MSVDYSVPVVYGVIVDKKEFVEKYCTKRSCIHNVDTANKYCSDCGKPMYKKESIHDFLETQNCKYVEFFELDSYSENDTFVIGIKTACGGSYRWTSVNDIKMPTPNEIDELNIVLEDLGISGPYGIHFGLQVS